MLPDGRDNLYLPSFLGNLVSSSWVIACAKIEIALDATPFGTKSSVKQLSPTDVVLLADQEVKLGRILLIRYGKYGFGIDVEQPRSYCFLK